MRSVESKGMAFLEFYAGYKALRFIGQTGLIGIFDEIVSSLHEKICGPSQTAVGFGYFVIAD